MPPIRKSADLSPLPGTARTVTRPPLHPLEGALVGVTALHLCFLPWALGTMHVWSQFTSLGLASVGFILALLPRTPTGVPSGTPVTVESPPARLRRFPVFWAGLAVAGYIAVQGCNPAWRYASNADTWWLEPIAHLSWLPSGVSAPFAKSSPWRALVIFGSLWLVVCSVWSGFLRRRSYRVLFTVLGANALVLALLGLLQQLTGTDRIFWSYLPANDKFMASFIYPNHGAPYFNLMVALALGLGWWHGQRTQRHLESPAWAVGFILSAAFSVSMVVNSGSRMSILLLLAFAILSGLALAGRRSVATPGKSAASLPLVFALVVALLLGGGFIAVRADKVWSRFTDLTERPVEATGDRRIARQATAEMIRDRWLFGWGAGCFRHVFPLHARHHPALIHWPDGRSKHWEHAHSDLLEFPAELGAAGILPVAVILGIGAGQLVRRRFWLHSVPLFLALGGALLLLHAWVDFVFQNPAVLLTWGVLMIGAIRWVEVNPPATATRSGR